MEIFKLMQDLRVIGWFEYQLVDEGMQTEHISGELVCSGGLFTAYFQMMEDSFNVEFYIETKIGSFVEIPYERAGVVLDYINNIVKNF